MTDPSPSHGQTPLSAEETAAGEKYTEPDDPGPEERYAGDRVPDPWEEVPDGEVDPGSVPDQSQG